MGMSAEILALGPFDPSLVLHLPRPPELAHILSIDPWAIEQHHLDPARIDASALDRADFAPTSTIERLRAAGFSFHFVLDP
jgi:hypothetical protein